MSKDRVVELIEAFAAAAGRARRAGFDAVELQCGLGYLVAQFLSPRTNQRTDEYGGDEAKRQRFARDVVHAVLESLDGTLPLLTRVSGTEGVDGGIGVDDAKQLGRQLEAWGVAALHVVSGSACDSPPLSSLVTWILSVNLRWLSKWLNSEESASFTAIFLSKTKRQKLIE